MNNTTQTEISVGADKVLDVRAIPCSIKHGLIVRTFQDLAVRDYFVLRNDHDPARLHDQFAAHWPGTFTWEYTMTKQEDFRVKITKLKALPANGAPAPMRCAH